MYFLKSLSPNGYIVLALIILVAVSLYAYLWKNFKTLALIILIIFSLAAIYFGFGLGEDPSDYIISVPGLGK